MSIRNVMSNAAQIVHNVSIILEALNSPHYAFSRIFVLLAFCLRFASTVLHPMWHRVHFLNFPSVNKLINGHVSSIKNCFESTMPGPLTEFVIRGRPEAVSSKQFHIVRGILEDVCSYKSVSQSTLLQNSLPRIMLQLAINFRPPTFWILLSHDELVGRQAQLISDKITQNRRYFRIPSWSHSRKLRALCTVRSEKNIHVRERRETQFQMR